MAYRNIEDKRKYERNRYATNIEYREKIKKRTREYKKKKHLEDPEYRKQCSEAKEKWHMKNMGYDLARKRALYQKCKIETPWLFPRKRAKGRCNNPSNKDYKYYGAKGIRMLLTKEEVEILYKRDHADRMKKPSIDRINPDGNYCFGNCRFIEQSENSSQAQKRRWHLHKYIKREGWKDGKTSE